MSQRITISRLIFNIELNDIKRFTFEEPAIPMIQLYYLVTGNAYLNTYIGKLLDLPDIFCIQDYLSNIISFFLLIFLSFCNNYILELCFMVFFLYFILIFTTRNEKFSFFL